MLSLICPVGSRTQFILYCPISACESFRAVPKILVSDFRWRHLAEIATEVRKLLVAILVVVVDLILENLVLISSLIIFFISEAVLHVFRAYRV